MTRIAVCLAFFAAVLAVLTFSAQYRERIMGKGEQDGVHERISATLPMQEKGCSRGTQLSQSINGGFLPILWETTNCRTYQTRTGEPKLSEQLLGYLRPGLVWPTPGGVESHVARLSGRDRQTRTLEIDSVEIPWRGLVVLPDFSVVMVDPEFAATMFSVMACESQFRMDAVGAAGELGLLQIHPIHQKRMEDMGLDFTKENDRVVFANALWQEQGWRPWSCQVSYRSDGTSGEW